MTTLGATAPTNRSRSSPRGCLALKKKTWRMEAGELDRMFALTQRVGRVELKFTVAEESHKAAHTLLGTELEPARRVYFLDTPDLALRDTGVLARVRGAAGHRPGDSVIKLRPTDPDAVAPSLRRARGFTIEVDLTPHNFVCSAALKTNLGRQDVDLAIKGKTALRTLFTDRQLRLLAKQAPDAPDIDKLQPMGPVEVRRCRSNPSALNHLLDLQQWSYPDGTRLLEISTRCTAPNLHRVANRTTALLRKHGIDLAGPCPTKADTTLDFFAGQG